MNEMNETRQQPTIPRGLNARGKDESAASSGREPGREGRLLDSFKRRAYLAVLPLGVLSALFSWSLWRRAGQEGPLAAVTDPALAVFCGVLFAVLLVGKERVVRVVECVGFTGVVAYFVADRYHVIYILA